MAVCSVDRTVVPARAIAQQSDQAGAALREGRRLLKRGQADKALVQLRNALNLYTAAKNNSGMAAAHNELGDLYMRQGQYQVALDNYQKALDGFIEGDKKEAVNTAAVSAVAPGAAPLATIADDKYNANLMLAKIGDVNFRLGKIAEARAAYSRMVVKKPEGAASKAGRRFGGFGAIAGGISTGRVSVAAPTSAVTSAAGSEEGTRRVSRFDRLFELRTGNGSSWLTLKTIWKAQRSISERAGGGRQQHRWNCEARTSATFSRRVANEPRRRRFAAREVQRRHQVLQRREKRRPGR